MRPKCSRHPDSRVWRDGKYGKRGQYQRWKCVPRNGDPTHLFQPTLPMKEVGGMAGACIECSRKWDPGEGMPTGRRDRFSIRDRAAALVMLSRGQSYRATSRELRRRAGEISLTRDGVVEVSNDGRLAMDWVPHYTSLLAREYLPQRWPEVLLLDALPFHVRDVDDEGFPKKSGRMAFVVLAAMSYGDGSEKAAKKNPREPLLWKVAADEKRQWPNWVEFLQSLEGSPNYVVCDQEKGLLKALNRVWPKTAVYPCDYHLKRRIEGKLWAAGLRKGRLWDSLHDATFGSLAAYEAFLAAVLEAADSDLETKQRDAVGFVQAWVAKQHDLIIRSIEESHAPRTTGGLEKYLTGFKNALSWRRALFRNLDRLDDLLVLIQMQLNGLADERQWAEVLRAAHQTNSGRIPGRRFVDSSRRRIKWE